MKLLVTGGSGFIGTNLVEFYLHQKIAPIKLINIDINKPKLEGQLHLWKNCDILDLNTLLNVFEEFQPTHVVHLAAITDSSLPNLGKYVTNTDGTNNVLVAIKATPSVQRSIITSTQFVCGPGAIVSLDDDYAPHTVYGESKAIAEKMVRECGLTSIWTIIRPTNIWGPWHPRYPYEFWKILKKGLYFHPGKEPVIRSYGYVGNVVYQIDQILESPSETVDKKTYYVGDQPINLYDWVNGFSLAISNKKARIMPRKLMYYLAIFGDIFSKAGVKFPITRSRYQSMTQDYPAPMEKTFDVFGLPPYSLSDGIKITTQWLHENHF